MNPAGRLRALVLTAALVTGACQSRPRAPMLDTSPVYTNKNEGIRFLVPEGWSQQMKGEVTPGKLEKERTLVLYRSLQPTPASFELSCRDLPEDQDLGEFLTRRKRSGSEWKRVAPPETVQFGGRKGTRYILQAMQRDRPTTNEIVVFRRGERVYFFGGLYPTGDPIRKSHVRQFLDSLQWTE